jgi:predicted O-methyltransferase YrrM
MLGSIRRIVKHRLAALLGDVIRDIIDRDSSRQLFDILNERQRIALNTTAHYVAREMRHADVLEDRSRLLRFALAKVTQPGLYLEFGVATGTTVNLIAAATPSHVYGFDSFAGLPEAWPGYLPKGAFRQEQLPVVRENVELVVGLFEDTLPPFLLEHPDPVAFLHIDCDLYSSTKTVLDHLGPRIRSGSIIVFDEYFNYPGWEEGEHRAFTEFVAARSVSYTYLAYTNSQQVAVRIN